LRIEVEPLAMRQHPTRPEIFIDGEGRIFRLLPVWRDGNGYHVVHLSDQRRERRHTLICETHHGLRPAPGYHVRHLNGDPGDDHPSNLAWGTPTENAADTVTHGRTTRGRKNARAVLTLAQAQEAWDRYKQGETAKALGDDFDVSPACIHDIAKGRTWPDIDRGL
jgi:hypothetical protein